MLCRLARVRLPLLLPTVSLRVRPFATVPVEKKLKRVLEKEFEHEKKEYKIDESVGPFLQDHGFTLEERPDQIEMRLVKTEGATEVSVYFSARSPDGAPEEAEGQEKQEEDTQQNWVDFQVTINNSGKGLIFECSTANSEIQINNVVCSQDVKKSDRVTSFISSQKEYRGPDFDGLDEELQKAFLDYLRTFGVDEDLATFVETYSLDKEQRLYMEWLNKVKNFIS